MLGENPSREGRTRCPPLGQQLTSQRPVELVCFVPGAHVTFLLYEDGMVYDEDLPLNVLPAKVVLLFARCQW
jgi:hypothetical protein